ncbi:MAG: glycoside hydrolase family 13 protein [Bacteroidales bacterium]|nr:glycoside hydrolase family 13 protein [Bacteroidales bacterium]
MTYNSNIPQWAAEAVWYQIFPDRFCRINTQCPIDARDIAGTAPWNIKPDQPWQIHPWTSDWHVRMPYEKANGKTLHDNQLRRRYCGDINGIISKLDYLRDLGVTALYITPMQYSPSLHRYDGTNFLHIDPFLGTTPREDIETIANEDFDDFANAHWTTADREALRLIQEAHKKGFKVVFDGVFNHIGYNSKPFQDVLRNRQKSKYADWFHIDWEKTTATRLCYEKFWGFVKEMPKLNYGCPEVRNYVLATLKRWLRPVVDGTEYEGIDGWRIDHAIGVPMTFWKSAHDFTKQLNNNSLFLAEFIEPDNIIKPYLDYGAFDSVMNYGFYFLACEFFTREDRPMSARKFDSLIWQQLKLYPLSANYLAMNLLGTHDTERIASLIVNRRLRNYEYSDNSIESFFHNTHSTCRGYMSRRPNEEERRIQRMMIVFEFAMIGSPMVYYGDELGMYGANDPDCRKPMWWPEIEMDDECEYKGGLPNYKSKHTVSADMDMLYFYKKIIALRRGSKALIKGTMSTDFASADSRVWVISRRCESERVILAFNVDDKPTNVKLRGHIDEEFSDYWDGDSFVADQDGNFEVDIEPRGFRVLLSPCLN